MNKDKGGRPTKYDSVIQEKADEYLENFTDHGDMFPSIVGLAIVLKVSKSTIHLWKTQEDKWMFSDTLDQINQVQEKTLLQEGLKGEYNATITKLALANHGYHEKVDTDVTSGGNKIENNFIIHPLRWIERD